MLAEDLTRDLYTYVNEGMGYWKLHEQPHREMCEALEAHLPPPPDKMDKAIQRKFMLLAPRETLKTSIGAQGLLEYFLLKWKVQYGYDGRCALVRAARENAYEVLNSVSLDLSTQNPVLQRAFGNLSRMRDGTPSPTWKKESIILGWRDKVLKEPSISTAAPGVSLTGKHLDLIIIDDIANETNYISAAKMKAAWTYIQSLDPVLSPWGSMIVIGTRWGVDDPYGKILELNEREIKEGREAPWDVMIRSVYRNDEGNEGKLYYPAFLTEERIAQKRNSLEEKLFTSWYLNDIIADSSRVFKSSYLRWYEGNYTPDDDEIAELELTSCTDTSLKGNAFPVRCTVHIDAATTVTDDANFTAYHIVLTDIEGRHFVHKSVKRKMTPSETISNVVADCREYVPRVLSIDVLGQQILWVNLISGALREAGLRVSILENKGKGKEAKLGRGQLSKARKIESLEPLFRQGKIFFRSGFCNALLHEYDTYAGPTKQNHYDALDALSHILTMTSKPDAAHYKQDLEALEEAVEFEDEAPRRRVAWAGR